MGDPFADVSPGVARAPASGLGIPPPVLPPSSDQSGQGNSPLDILGRGLFGQGNGSLLGGIPVIGDLGRFSGEAAHGLAGLAIAPIEAAATVASHIPTGWVPGGADETFRMMGDWMKVNDPTAYAQWQIVDARSGADFLGGGNMKSDFNREWGQKYAALTKEGVTGALQYTPGLAFGPAGSLGGALVDALSLWDLVPKVFGAPSGGDVQKAIMNQNVFEGVSETRIQQVLDRATAGMDLNPIEQQVVDHLKDGSWSTSHAQNFMIENNQGLSRDFVSNMAGAITTDPLTYMMLGGGALLKLGKAGEAVLGTEVGLQAGGDVAAARSALQSLQAAVRYVQLAGPEVKVGEATIRPLQGIYKVIRASYDPFGVLPKNTATQGTIDLMAGGATKALDGIYGPASISGAFETAARHGFTTELQGALGNYMTNLARQYTVTAYRARELLSATKGEALIGEVTPDSVVDMLMKTAPRDVVTRLTDYGYGLRQQFVGNVADDIQLAGRIATGFGKQTVEAWAADVAKMGDELKSMWHAGTYSRAEAMFTEAMAKVTGYTGRLPLGRVVIMNDNKLDNVAAQVIEELLGEADGVAAKMKVWNDAAAKYSAIGDIGRAQASSIQLRELETQLRQLIESGRLHTRITPDELVDTALKPVNDFLETTSVGGKQLWNLGFAPDDLHIWGFNRDPLTDLLKVTSEPFVTHVVDAVPAARPVNDVLSNLLGQVIGPAAASKIVKPIEAMEVSIKTARDIVSGQRLVMNMEQRFNSSMAKLGLPGRESRRLFRAARDVAQLERTTIQGMTETNVWDAVAKTIPEDLKLLVTPRIVMHELLAASGGDLRIMGLTSGFTQRIRTMLDAIGLPENYAGRATSTFYRTVRYSLNPAFFIQRVTDGIYFAILKGVSPVWTARALKEGSPLWQMEQILGKMGETALARDMGMDMPEMVLRSKTQEILRAKLGDAASMGRLEGIARSGGRWQALNQYALAASHTGEILTESLSEARAAFEKLAVDPAFSDAERQMYRDALDGFTEFSDIQAQYAKNAGRILSDKEIGLKYIYEQTFSELGSERGADGLLRFREDIRTGFYHKPANIGAMEDLRLPFLATDLGYVTAEGLPDVAALRQAISPTGTRSTEWLQEVLSRDFSADPDYIKRAVSALRFDSGKFWGNARSTLDLSPHETEALRGVIAREAISRGMGPNEYLSQVLHTNLGKIGANDHLGQLLQVIKGGFVGSERQQIEKLANIFMGTMDLSAQRAVLANYIKTLPDMAKQAYDSGDLAQWKRLNRVQDFLVNGASGEVPKTLDEYAALWNDIPALHLVDEKGMAFPTVYEVASSVGPGAYLLSPEDQSFLAQTFHQIRADMPNISVRFDVQDLDTVKFPLGVQTKAVTLSEAFTPAGRAGNTIVVTLDSKRFGEAGAALRAEDAARTERALSRETFTVKNAAGKYVEVPRKSVLGVPYNFGNGTMRDNIWHEMAHVVEDSILSDKFKGSPIAQDFVDFVKRYSKSPGRKFVSEYSFRGEDVAAEAWAELFNLAFNPDHAGFTTQLRRAIDTGELALGTESAANRLLKDIGEARSLLTDSGIIVPDLAAPGFTSRGAAALTGEGFADLVARRAAGEAITNPDIEAIVQGFVKWTKDTVAGGLAEGSRSWVGKLANELASKVPVDNAYLFNRSESLVNQLLRNKIVLAQRDAFRLAEMSSERTMFGRSLNHPVFGLYPSSYMWGKVFPEIVKFLVRDPFGFETSGAAYEIAKVEAAIAIQREYDPNSTTVFDKLATGPTAFLFDYLTPSLPTSDMRAASAPWAQAVAKSGFDIGKMTEAEFKTIDPRRWFKFFGQSGTEIAKGVQGLVSGATKPTATGQLNSLVGQGAQAAPAAARPTGAVGALGAPLNNAMDELTSLFNQ